jgi:hypothetical protein
MAEAGPSKNRNSLENWHRKLGDTRAKFNYTLIFFLEKRELGANKK